MHEKYLQLARDAASMGDRIMAESYFQHAEHYYRIIATFQEQQNVSDPNRRYQEGAGYGQDYRGQQGGEGGEDYGDESGDGQQPRDGNFSGPSEGNSYQGQPDAGHRQSSEGGYRPPQESAYRGPSDGNANGNDDRHVRRQQPESDDRSREFDERRPAEVEDRSGRLHLSNGEPRSERAEIRIQDAAPEAAQTYGPVRYGAPMDNLEPSAEPSRRAPRPRRERVQPAASETPSESEPASES